MDTLLRYLRLLGWVLARPFVWYWRWVQPSKDCYMCGKPWDDHTEREWNECRNDLMSP